MRAAVIVNSGAGAVLRQGLEADSLRRGFAEAGVDAEVHLVAGGRVAETARAALAAGVDAVVAGGGDGTVRAVAAALSGRREALGVLPLGTLNHFAKDVGIPPDLDQAIAVVAAGSVRALDLGEVNGEVFVNNSSIGFYPPVVAARDEERRRLGRGKWTATASALWKVLPRLPPLDIRLSLDGREVRRHTHFAFVGNNAYAMSFMSYGARSRLDSGELYLYVARCAGRTCLMALALLSLVRDLAQTRHFDAWCLPEFSIGTRRKVLPVYLDGEVVALAPPLRFRNRTHALRVIVPAPPAEAR